MTLRKDRSIDIFAVDPGEAWCGFAWFHLVRPGPHQCDCPFGCSSNGAVRLLQCLTFRPPDECFDYLDTNLHRASVLVLERFRLYPWMARQQGFSSFGTAESIGVIKRIARRLDVPVVLQDAAGNLKDGRAFASTWGFPMVERKLGSGRYTYFGPDFDLPGKPHRRDAAAHGCSYIGGSGKFDRYLPA